MKSKKTMFDLVKIPFSRKGSYLSVLNKQEGRDIDRGSVDELYLSRSWNNSCALKRTDLIKLSLLHDGVEVPYEYYRDSVASKAGLGIWICGDMHLTV